MTPQQNYLDHFLTVAKRRGHPGASGGEQRAHELASAICEQVPGLDASAAAGAIEFIRLAASKPWEAKELLEP